MLIKDVSYPRRTSECPGYGVLKIVKKLLAMWTDSPFLRSVVKSPVVDVSAVYLIRRILFKFSTRTFMIVPEQFNQDLTTM